MGEEVRHDPELMLRVVDRLALGRDLDLGLGNHRLLVEVKNVRAVLLAGASALDFTAAGSAVCDEVRRRDDAVLTHGVIAGGDYVGGAHGAPPLLRKIDCATCATIVQILI